MTTSESVAETIFARALNDCWRTIKRTIPRMGTDRPNLGNADGTYTRCGDHDWVDGFWSGQLWLAYSETRDPAYFEAARAQRPYFFERLARPETHDHDMGFLYSLSLAADYMLTGDTTSRDGALRAAESLAGRYNPTGRFIRAWNDWGEIDNRGRIIIDCLENLCLLYWAANITGDPEFAVIATEHAHTARRHIVRPDRSTYHTYLFDADTGQPLRGETYQGYSHESCWSRGQAWGIHGFSQIYRHTGDRTFLETAQALAAYAIEHLPSDSIPYWDYRLPPGVPQYRDTSAAAITAAGLLSLADQVSEPAVIESYTRTAHNILTSLAEHYSTRESAAAEGLLMQGAADVPRGLSSAMLPYGDYFYVEALMRALGHKDFFW
jgi:unsaturated chondroitin disaccharide hydrolase